jgi:imidazolonepropionase-like amidohydrolase
MAKTIAFLFCWLVPSIGFTQDLLITNARIHDGTGRTVERGSLLARDGRIVSVSEGAIEAPELMRIDAGGMTIVPGLIDTHTHLLIYSFARSPEALEAWTEAIMPRLLQEILAAGVTTVSNNGDFFPAIADVRARLESGDPIGPRMLTAGPIFGAPDGHPAATVCQGDAFCRESVAVEVTDPDIARSGVRELADAGVNAIKAVYHQPGLPGLDDAVLQAIADEAEAQGLPFVVHELSFTSMITAAELGADRFAHTPHEDVVDPERARQLLGDAEIPISTTLAGVSRRLKPANLKALRDSGVNLALGTDVPVFLGYGNILSRELLAPNEIFSEEQVLAMATRNAAAYLGLDAEIGTLEPGKQADIVLVDGDPLEDISSLTNIVAVIQRGRLVVDEL